MKRFVATSTNLLSVLTLTLVLTLVLTACSSEEYVVPGSQEPEQPSGMLVLMAKKDTVEVSPAIFAIESGESYDATAVDGQMSVNTPDGNVLTAQIHNGVAKAISTNYGSRNGRCRTVTAVAYAKASNGDDLRSEVSYVQKVKEEYTYQVTPLRDRVDNTAQGNAEEVKNSNTYEIIRLKNGTPEKSWKVSFAKWSYLYSKGAIKEVYTASDAQWQATVSLIEGNAKNSLGDEIKLAHGTTSETTALKANVFDANGAKIGEDTSCIVANEVTKIYYGDITFVTTANARISAECTFQLTTMSNVTFTDAETGHREVIVSTTNGTLALAKADYEDNAEMSSTRTGSDGKVYSFKGDYTVSVDVNIESEKVFTSKTKYHSYAWQNEVK